MNKPDREILIEGYKCNMFLIAGVSDRGLACESDWNELLPDETVHRVCRRPSLCWPRAGQGCIIWPVLQWIEAFRLFWHCFCPSFRCTMLKIHLTSWRPFPWRGKPTSLRSESQNIKDSGSCQTLWTLNSPWMQTSDTKTALLCVFIHVQFIYRFN